jgi:hypothetical protein
MKRLSQTSIRPRDIVLQLVAHAPAFNNLARLSALVLAYSLQRLLANHFCARCTPSCISSVHTHSARQASHQAEGLGCLVNMDLDMGDACLNSSQDQGHRPASQLERQMSVHHECCHRCSVEHLFGNMFRCCSSGQLHCCDSTCQQRVYNDRYSTICRISKKVFYHDVILEATPARSVFELALFRDGRLAGPRRNSLLTRFNEHLQEAWMCKPGRLALAEAWGSRHGFLRCSYAGRWRQDGCLTASRTILRGWQLSVTVPTATRLKKRTSALPCIVQWRPIAHLAAKKRLALVSQGFAQLKHPPSLGNPPL